MPKKSIDCWSSKIGCSWDWDDLRKINSSLTDKQCEKVIQRLFDEFDQSVGLNRNIVGMMIDSVIYWERQEKER